jgi:prefoldin subunit 5
MNYIIEMATEYKKNLETAIERIDEQIKYLSNDMAQLENSRKEHIDKITQLTNFIKESGNDG